MAQNRVSFWGALLLLALITIAAMVVFPFISSPSKRPSGMCPSHLRQLGLALLQYTQDYDQCFPNIAASPGSRQTWRTTIFHYVRVREVFQCPERDDKVPGPDGFPRSYAANYTGNYSGSTRDQGRGAFAGPGSDPVKLAQIKEPSALIALCEIDNSDAPELNIDDANRFGPDKVILWVGHEGSSNYLLADGHVQLLKPYETASYAKPAQAGVPLTGTIQRKNLWYRDNSQALSGNGREVLHLAQVR